MVPGTVFPYARRMRVLAIETSCDETAAAVVESESVSGGKRESGGIRVLSNVVASQADLHARTAGVVPEVAARAHVEAITFVIDDALREVVGSGPKSNKLPAISLLDAIAVTTEPGLRPALVIGETAARALAAAWDKPLIPVNHLAGHIAAAWLLPETGDWRLETGTRRHRFPAVVLIVSGGHTQLWKLVPREGATTLSSTSELSSLRAREDSRRWRLTLLGQTRDDAAGEAFDKIARLLGLSYPGGAALAQLAEGGDACAFSFPRPMIARPAKPWRSGGSQDLDFSFSGLKTAVYYTVEKLKAKSYKLKADLAASAQEAIVDVLVAKTVEAAAREGAAEVILTGGVAANTRLRERWKAALGSLPLIVPPPRFCTDNAAMVGAAAVLGLQIPKEDRCARRGMR